MTADLGSGVYVGWKWLASMECMCVGLGIFQPCTDAHWRIKKLTWIPRGPQSASVCIIILFVVYSLSYVRLFWDPMDYSPSGSSVHGISQARILAWVAMPSSRGSSQPKNRTPSLMSSALAVGFFTISAAREAHCLNPTVCCAVLSHFSRVWLFVTLWTVARQAPLSMRFSRQEHWSGLPCPEPRYNHILFPLSHHPGCRATSSCSLNILSLFPCCLFWNTASFWPCICLLLTLYS